MSVVTSPYASVRLILNRILNRDHVIQSSEDKIIMKINIHVPYARTAKESVLFFSIVFSFCSILFVAMCGSCLANKSKRNQPVPCSTNSETCILLDLLIAYTLLPWGNDFRVRVCSTHSLRFLSSKVMPPHIVHQVESPSILRYFVSFHIPRFAMLAVIECSARIKILYDAISDYFTGQFLAITSRSWRIVIKQCSFPFIFLRRASEWNIDGYI